MDGSAGGESDFRERTSSESNRFGGTVGALYGEVREDVLREVRHEARNLAREGMSTKEIDLRLNRNRGANGTGKLSEAERDIVYLLAYHAAAEARGHF